jgi:hypothetical protein
MGLLTFLAVSPGAAAPWTPIGAEFRANDHTFGHQFNPAVASDSEGRLLVVWLDQARNGVFAQRYDAAGQPAAREFRVDDDLDAPFFPINFPVSPLPPYFGPRVASGPDGGFLVVWPTHQGVRARLYDAAGASRTGSFPVSSEGMSDLDVAGRPGGGYVVVWTDVEGPNAVIFYRFFDARGVAVGGTFQVNQAPSDLGTVRWPRVAVDGAGGFVVTWERGREAFTGGSLQSESDIWARRFNASGQPLAGEVRVNAGADDDQYGAAPIVHADGGFSVVWNNAVEIGNGFDVQAVAQRFDAAGARLGSPVRLAAQGGDFAPPVVAAGPDGNPVVLWGALGPRDPGLAVVGRAFDDRWRPLGGVFQVNTYTEFDQTNPALAVDGQGRFVAVWVSGELPVPQTPPPAEWGGQDGSSYGVYGQRFKLSTCAAGASTLCLNGGRFQVEVAWTDPRTGNSGVGHAVPRTGDTGLFWFFQESNVELIVKVLDGRLINGHFWVFYGSLTDVEFVLTVIDTVTEARETYHNPPYHMASWADTSAFEDEAVTAAVAALQTEPIASGTLEEGPAAGVGEATLLRLAGGRFHVEVAWTDPRTGNSGLGRAVSLSGDTGAFWFFQESNLEVVVKVLDGQLINGAFWVFYGSLSDVEYTVTVTDTVTQKFKRYRNPPFTLASRADTAAFPVPAP